MTAQPQDFARPRVGDTIGPYRLVRELGTGSHGVVYLAQSLDAGAASTPVALKLVRPQRRGDAKRDTILQRAAARTGRHAIANVCPVLGSGMHGDLPYLVLRYIDGPSLAQHLRDRRGRSLPRRAVHDALLRQFEKLALALHQLHARRITHRDVKPGNVMLDREGEPWLIDCGLTDDPAHDGGAPVAGSLAYLAPELLDGTGRPGAASDLYALGVTLFEAMTGQRPHTGTSGPQVLQEMWSKRRPKARQLERSLPPDLDVVLDRLLHHAPARRYPDGATLADDLRRVRERLPLATPREPLPVRCTRWVQLHPLATAVLLALSATLIGLGWWSVHSERALRQTDLLAAGSFVDIAEQSGFALLPANVDALPAVRDWLAEYDGPRGLRVRHADVLAALAELGFAPAHAPMATNARPNRAEDLEAELHALEAVPRFTPALRQDATLAATFAPLLPALERHRAELTASLDGGSGGACLAGDAPPLVHELREVERALARATGPRGVVAQMQTELAALERVAQARLADAILWRRTCIEIDTAPEYLAARAHGFRMQPVDGLHPLGPDPRSALQEFAWLRSGRVPKRDAEGRLELAADAAIVFVLLPGGTFEMGTSVQVDPLAGYEEEPSQSIELAPFLLAKHELSQAQWLRIGGEVTFILRAGDRLDAVTIDERHPAEGMGFAIAEAVLARNGLRLPTEAQWEYAARRGGLLPPFRGHANLRDADDGHPVCHAPIGSFAADPSGLHDLHGNVPEMVVDPFGGYDLYPPRPGDGRRCSWRFERVARGGGFYNTAKEARATARAAMPDLGPLPFVGIRPALGVARP